MWLMYSTVILHINLTVQLVYSVLEHDIMGCLNPVVQLCNKIGSTNPIGLEGCPLLFSGFSFEGQGLFARQVPVLGGYVIL